MIWSVSTLLRRSGSAVPVCVVNLSTDQHLLLEIGGGGHPAPHGGGGGGPRPGHGGAAARPPGASWPGFVPSHRDPRAARHSAPASLKITSRPSDSACSRTRAE